MLIPARLIRALCGWCRVNLMKQTRVLTTLIVILGAVYIEAGFYLLRAHRDFVRGLERLGVSDAERMNAPGLAGWRVQVFYGAVVFLILGPVMVVIGFGLLHVKEWARRAWLGVSGVVVAFHLLRLGAAVLNGLSAYWVVERVAELALAGALAGVSWRHLTREPVKSFFRADAGGAT
jgi:hypothetical protein